MKAFFCLCEPCGISCSEEDYVFLFTQGTPFISFSAAVFSQMRMLRKAVLYVHIRTTYKEDRPESELRLMDCWMCLFCLRFSCPFFNLPRYVSRGAMLAKHTVWRHQSRCSIKQQRTSQQPYRRDWHQSFIWRGGVLYCTFPYEDIAQSSVACF